MSALKKVAFFGGSVPAGIGYPELKDAPELYPNLIKKLGYEIENWGRQGSNNDEIFLSCCNQLTRLDDCIVVVEWNTFHRFRFYPAPDVEVFISSGDIQLPEPSIHVPRFSKKDLEVFRKTLFLLTHEYHSITKLIDYCAIVHHICNLKNIPVVMLNGFTPWTRDLFYTHDSADLKSKLSEFSRSVLDFDYRDDSELLELLNNLSTSFKKIDQTIWTNIFENFLTLSVDRAPLDQHPGPKTNQMIADMIVANLKERKII